MAKKKKRKKKKVKKSRKASKSRKKTRKVKKSRKASKPRKKNRKKSKTKSKKPRKLSHKAPKLIEDGDGKSLIKVSDSWANHAYVNKSQYLKKYKLSIKENEKFWAKEGKRITWIKKYSKIKDVKYSKDDVRIKWYYDCLLYTSPSPRDLSTSRMPSSA